MPVIRHILFNSVAKLPPLYNELIAASSDDLDCEVFEVVNEEEGMTPPQLPKKTRVKRARLVLRRLSRRQTGILKLLRFAEWTVRAFFEGLRPGCDILTAHDLPAAPAAWAAARLSGKRIIYNAHEMWGESNGVTAPHPILWRRLDRFICPRVDAVIAPQSERARIYKEEYGARNPVVIRNLPPRREPLKSDLLRDFVRRRNRDADTLILYQGIFDPGRGLDALIEAMTMTDERAALVIIGRGNEQQTAALSTAIDKFGLGARVFLHPFIAYQKLFEYTCSADIGVLFYKGDCRNNLFCAPNKLYEYMQAGLAVLGSNVPGLSSVIETGRVGLIVDSDNPAAIAAGLNTLLPEESRAEYRRRALELSAGEFHWEAEYQLLRKTYYSIAKD